MSDAFIGEIRLVGFDFPPKGWLFCRGQLLSIQSFSALFALLGTTYGGNGVSNFAVPNLQGRAPVKFGSGPGLSPYAIGETLGEEAVTLLSIQMPQHSHTAVAAAGAADARDPRGNLPSGTNNLRYAATAPDTTMHSNTVAVAGGNQSHDNMAPFLALSYIIATQGNFPIRN